MRRFSYGFVNPLMLLGLAGTLATTMLGQLISSVVTPLPDYSINAKQSSVKFDTNIFTMTYSIDITNLGAGSREYFDVYVSWENGRKPQLLLDKAGLESGQTYRRTFRHSFPFATQPRVTFYVDYRNRITEANEENNRAVVVNQPSSAEFDIALGSITFTKTGQTNYAGNPLLTASVEIKNIGNSPICPSIKTFEIKSYTGTNIHYAYLDTFNSIPLSCTTINRPGSSVRIPLPTQTYQTQLYEENSTYTFFLDPLGYITTETDRRNNLKTVVARSGGEINNPTPSINGVSGPTSLTVGQKGTWTINATDQLNGSLRYSVKWGDEVPTDNYGMARSPALPIQQTAIFTHTYAKSGIFYPVFTVTNQNGQSAESSISVNVGNTSVSNLPDLAIQKVIFYKNGGVGDTGPYALVEISNIGGGSVCAQIKTVELRFFNINNPQQVVSRPYSCTLVDRRASGAQVDIAGIDLLENNEYQFEIDPYGYVRESNKSNNQYRAKIYPEGYSLWFELFNMTPTALVSSTASGYADLPYAYELMTGSVFVSNSGPDIPAAIALTMLPKITFQDFMITKYPRYVPSGQQSFQWNPSSGEAFKKGQQAEVVFYGYFTSGGTKIAHVTLGKTSDQRSILVRDNTGCIDPNDGGKNQYSKGATIGFTSCPNNTTCAYATRSTDHCLDNTTLKEYYCAIDSRDGKNKKFDTNIPCENGCKDDECVNSVVQSYSCTDTDGGNNYQVKGVVTEKTSTTTSFTDYCEGSILKEHFCVQFTNRGLGGAGVGTYTCPNGCSDGACIGSYTPIPPTIFPPTATSTVTGTPITIINPTVTTTPITQIGFADLAVQSIAVKPRDNFDASGRRDVLINATIANRGTAPSDRYDVLMYIDGTYNSSGNGYQPLAPGATEGPGNIGGSVYLPAGAHVVKFSITSYGPDVNFENNFSTQEVAIEGTPNITPPPVTQSISLISPVGGETWYKDTPYTIAWQSTGFDKVRVNLSCESYGAGPFMDVPSGTTGGSYTFTPSSIMPDQSSCYVQVARNVQMLIPSVKGTDYAQNTQPIKIISPQPPPPPSNPPPTILPPVTPTTFTKRVFVTSIQGKGNLGLWADSKGVSGISGGNNICQTLAEKAGLSTSGNPAQFKAWLSDGATKAKENIGCADNKKYTLINGTIIAQSCTDLIDGSISNPITVNELGKTNTTSGVWTGTKADGVTTGGNCRAWTESGGITTAIHGSTTYKTSSWTFISGGTLYCDTAKSLYCFEQ